MVVTGRQVKTVKELVRVLRSVKMVTYNVLTQINITNGGILSNAVTMTLEGHRLKMKEKM